MEQKRYKIELTERQLRLLNYVVEKASRMICGQLDMGFQGLCEQAFERHDANGKIGTPEWYAMRDEVERHICELRTLCWKQGCNSYYGVKYDEKADILWDMHQVIRHALWMEKPGIERSHITVDSDEPMRYGEEPLIKVEKICQEQR